MIPTDDHLAQAHTRLRTQVRRTPILPIDGREVGSHGTLTLKLEQLQHTGSFKARGALNAVLTMPTAATSVTAASGGNHGAAVAWAARRQHSADHEAVHIDAYDQIATVAGQSTVGAELAEQIPPGDVVIVGGGGGLFAGVSLALRGRNTVIAAEPETAPSLAAAVHHANDLPGDRITVLISGANS
jgi:threonine dehydratase